MLFSYQVFLFNTSNRTGWSKNSKKCKVLKRSEITKYRRVKTQVSKLKSSVLLTFKKWSEVALPTSSCLIYSPSLNKAVQNLRNMSHFLAKIHSGWKEIPQGIDYAPTPPILSIEKSQKFRCTMSFWLTEKMKMHMI